MNNYNIQAADASAAIDPRLALLERAGARLTLFHAGAMELEEAFSGLIQPFRDILFERDIYERMDRYPRVPPKAKLRRVA